MTEKVGIIRNPLTIIAIFAGIAEISGTIVISNISDSYQGLFVYFLIGFPTLLVILFFITLNLNHKVLYAPSDFQDEKNFMQIHKFDIAEQKNVKYLVSKNDAKELEVLQLKSDLNVYKSKFAQLQNHISNDSNVLTKNSTDLDLVKSLGYDIKINNFDGVETFIESMRNLGIEITPYYSGATSMNRVNKSEYSAIWLGDDLDLDLSKQLIKESKSFYPHLRFIKILPNSGGDKNNVAFIGGSTNSAINSFKCKPLDSLAFETLDSKTNIKSFHDFIIRFSE